VILGYNYWAVGFFHAHRWVTQFSAHQRFHFYDLLLRFCSLPTL
jgi:hypothetical protein